MIKHIQSQYFNNIHQHFLIELPKIIQKIEHFKTLYTPKEFNNALFSTISKAYRHIYLIALYLENDQGGEKIFNALLQIKKTRPQVKIKILVDWHRAQRNRIGHISKTDTNINWYYNIITKNPKFDIPIYGIPININEILGILHLKGCIIDNTVLYSGANLNNEYLHLHNKYRYDRYHIINNQQLSNSMLNYIEQELLSSPAVKKLEQKNKEKKFKNHKNNIRLFRQNLRKSYYHYHGNATFHELSITPLVGLGKKNILNQTIHHLIYVTKNKIILCTPYFNIPKILIRNLIHLLHTGKKIEIIVGDKTANDFYVPTHKPFKLINTIPYLYEVNLRHFLKKLQQYIDNKQLTIRLWQDNNNSFHIKGIWIDDEWQLLTGNNLNSRSLKLDLENALLIHDPKKSLSFQTNKELHTIRSNTQLITHYTSLQDISDYPKKIKQIIHKIRSTRFYILINQIL